MARWAPALWRAAASPPTSLAAIAFNSSYQALRALRGCLARAASLPRNGCLDRTSLPLLPHSALSTSNIINQPPPPTLPFSPRLTCECLAASCRRCSPPAAMASLPAGTLLGDGRYKILTEIAREQSDGLGAAAGAAPLARRLPRAPPPPSLPLTVIAALADAGGGSAVVYKAVDQTTGDYVACKILNVNDEGNLTVPAHAVRREIATAGARTRVQHAAWRLLPFADSLLAFNPPSPARPSISRPAAAGLRSCPHVVHLRDFFAEGPTVVMVVSGRRACVRGTGPALRIQEMASGRSCSYWVLRQTQRRPEPTTFAVGAGGGPRPARPPERARRPHGRSHRRTLLCAAGEAGWGSGTASCTSRHAHGMLCCRRKASATPHLPPPPTTTDLAPCRPALCG